MPGIRTVKLDKIAEDHDAQPRVEINQATVEEYAEAITAGKKLPPVTIFRDKEGVNWLADGFTRVQAYRLAGREEINAEIIQGGKREAILFSVGANTDHGQRRTNADKRRAVETLLLDGQWARWSNRKIAEQCSVSDMFVGSIRNEMTANGLQSNGQEEQAREGRDGRIIKTSNIGQLKS